MMMTVVMYEDRYGVKTYWRRVDEVTTRERETDEDGISRFGCW